MSSNFRARLLGSAGGEPWLFHGELSPHYERALRQREVPAALRERAVPLRYWSEEQDMLLQPLAWLAPSETFTLALLGQGAVSSLHIPAEDVPRAERLFPAPGRPVRRLAVHCSAAFRAPLDGDLWLEPGHISALGTALAHPAIGVCLVSSAQQAPVEPVVLPPSFGQTLLPPDAFLPAAAPATSNALGCALGHSLLGACLEALDDRVLVTAGGEDLLWLIDEPEARVVVTSAAERVTLLSSLAPGSEVTLRGVVLGASGGRETVALSIVTLPAARHLVLNEVLANPLGPEPGSEWIELVNDSESPVELAGTWLEDGSSRTPLPSVRLMPREVVLLVPSGFRSSALDAPIAAGTRLLELPSLGARGLSNSGEALLLAGAEGVLSRFPALAAARAGRSIARRALDTADDAPAGFAEHGASGSSPGSRNVFD